MHARSIPLVFIQGALGLLPAWSCRADTYQERFDALVAKAPPVEDVETLLQEWETAVPDKPDALIAAANFWWKRAEALEISPRVKADEFRLLDEKGARVGSIGRGERDPALVDRAIASLRKATGKFPDRLDIWCGLAHLHEQSRQLDEEVGVLEKMVAHVKKAEPGNLRWMAAPLDEEPDTFVVEKLHAYALPYYRMEDTFGDEGFGRLVELLLREYPQSAVGWNDKALLEHFIRKDTPAAVAALEKAHTLAPDDFLIVFNMGKFALLGDDREKAREAFAKVAANKGDARLASQAKTELDALDGDSKE